MPSSAFGIANFGTLGSSNALGMADENENEITPALWNGELVEYRQDRIAKSAFQSSLEEEEKSPNQAGNVTSAVDDKQAIRYWSDFSRVYFLPRTLQKIPDPPEWEIASVDWNQGQELFTRFNEETELMDGTLRLFVEDCDNIQGVQILNDTDTFGSFMGSFFASFRDEYLKLPSFSFPILSGPISDRDEVSILLAYCNILINRFQTERTRKLVNEAMYLRTLNEFSSMNVPIEDPKLWPNSVWGAPLNFPSTSLYHQSAVLSAHVETCTLPFRYFLITSRSCDILINNRLNRNRYDIPSVSGHLSWRGTSPFAELSGLFPLTKFTREIVNFSFDTPTKSPYALWDVTRGLSPKKIEEYDTWSQGDQDDILFRIPSDLQSSVHASAFPLPNSFPEFHNTEEVEKKKNPETVEVYSSLSSSSNTSKIFEKYALFIETCIKRRTTSTASIDIHLDDLKDLANDLWTMHDNSSEDNGEL
ncbi:hypothetical protein CVT25_013141 [Psilocybe cyanescens]|uniref:DML1/Misato tubulin domain-containing protein n=1 Tax=Psilocybe cyanescens TaxID=93625 RepID=A0A409XK00_PSICY|nr:hypothetical protein CVT25_013141 [Psilocybe cyanescens]